jgi:hypothetical protein
VEAAAEGFLSGSRRALSVTSFNPDFPAFVALLNDLRLPVSPTAASRNIGTSGVFGVRWCVLTNWLNPIFEKWGMN